MTLLSICQEALEEIGETEVPDSIVGNENQTAVQMLALANREGRSLSRACEWSVLRAEHTFATVASQAAYDKPSDMRYIVNATWWDRANYWPLFGPATAQDWQQLQSGLVTSTTRRWFMFRGSSIHIYPTPSTSSETIAFEYITGKWCESSGGTGQTKFQADTDVAKLDEDLIRMGVIWRFLAKKGLPYETELAEYQMERDKAMARDGGKKVLNLGGMKIREAVNVPEGSWNL